MRLYCVSRYRSGETEYQAGQEVDVRDEEGEYLLRDSPGSFTTEAPGKAEPEAKKPKTKATATGIEAVDRGDPGGEVR